MVIKVIKIRLPLPTFGGLRSSAVFRRTRAGLRLAWLCLGSDADCQNVVLLETG